jgi:hypothetical protein
VLAMEIIDFLTNEDQKLISEIKRKVNSLASDPTQQKYHRADLIYPPTSLEEIQWAEAGIGTKLPPLIREIFLQVGNGGFGPGWGITGLLTGKKIYNRSFVENVRNSVIEIKVHLRESIEATKQLPDVNPKHIEQDKTHYENWNRLGLDNLIWYCDWGCNIVTLVDFSKAELPIYEADGLNVGEDSVRTLRQWWLRWLDDSTDPH